MRKMVNRLIAITVLPLTIFVIAVSLNVMTTSPNEIYNKIRIISEWDNDVHISSSENIEAKINSLNKEDGNKQAIVKFDFDIRNDSKYQEISLKRNKNMTWDEIDEFRDELSSYSYLYHKNILTSYINEYNISNSKIINYSPYIVIEYDNNVTVSEILNIASIDSVENIEVMNSIEALTNDEILDEPVEEVSYSTMLSQINGTSVVSSGSYTGDNVRIGIFESGGVANPSQFAGRDLIYRTGVTNSSTYTNHANFVTSVFYGIAPDATVYMSPVNEIGVEWFIDNRVSAVNCSFWYYRNTKNSDGTYSRPSTIGYYNSYDGVYDYQIQTNYITVIKSAGNLNTTSTSSSYNPGNNISSPGYARNVVTVGGVSGSSLSLSHASGASFVNNDNYAKPNVSAPFTVTNPHGNSGSGTSYATPQVTAAVALLFEKYPYLSIYPEQTAAAIEASSNHSILTDFSVSNSLGNHDDENGAGVIDIEQLLGNVEILSFYQNNNNLKSSNVLTTTVYLEKGESIKINLYWLSRFDINNNQLYNTDYDLRLVTPSNTISSSSASCNSELVMYTATTAGTYTINVYQYGNYSGVGYDFIGLAYIVY